MQYDEIVPQLLDRLPELRPEHARVIRDWVIDEPLGVYNVMDEIWQPFIQRAEDDQLRRAFQFIEELCQSSDREANFVASEYAWSQLGGTPLLEKARPYFGPLTRELVERCEAERINPAPSRIRLLWRRLTKRCRRTSPR